MAQWVKAQAAKPEFASQALMWLEERTKCLKLFPDFLQPMYAYRHTTNT